MADSIKNILSTPSRDYTVFETNQVLSSDQLNSLAAYINYQEHLTRAKLLGVGIVGGLQVTRTGSTVTVRKGVGVTTDGDVLATAADVVFDRFKPYGPASPRYAPFYVGETMRTLFELVRDDVADATAESLAALPVDLGELVVVMLMERYEDDPDLCSGTDCDNLGKTAIDTPRLLLVSREDASSLLAVPETVRQAALKLPALFAARPAISQSIASTRALANVYRDACQSIHNTLTENLGALNAQFPTVLGNPAVADWTARLAELQSQFSENRDFGIQYYYDFLKDVVDTWNELREVLLADDSVLCPDVNAFPRHLLLGGLTNPAEFRTGLFRSPLFGGQNASLDHAQFLVEKLETVINGFQLPSPNDIPIDGRFRVTPSRTESSTLEDRAVPWYYSEKIQNRWNFRLTQRGEAANIHGYHTSGPEVFARQIGRYDFFRVEGHLGQDVTIAKARIEKSIADYNLPFIVRAVLLHGDRRKIVVRPPIRYGDLHRFHHLLRKELSVQLVETKTFNESFKFQIDNAIKDKHISAALAQTASQSSSVKDAVEQAEPALAKASFTEYEQSRRVQDWRGGFKTVVNTANRFKGAFGEVTRANYATAFDTLLTNNHPAWLEWLEALIQSKDNQEDDKLLFSNFCEKHPGLEHFGGVIRGGTLVLVYDDQSQVVADFMLPYHWGEAAENEPKEPEELTTPSYKEPNLFQNSVNVLPPLDSKFDQRLGDFETKFKVTLKDQLNIQKDQLQFLKDYGQVFSGKMGTGAVDPSRSVSDPLLKSHLDEVDYKKRLAEDLRGVVINPETPDDVREKTRGELGRVELELADAITRSSTFLVDTGTSLEPGSDGSKAIAVIAQGMEKVTSERALGNLKAFGAGVSSPKLQQVFKLRGT